MVHDHTDANNKLTMIAMAHGYSTPLQAGDAAQAALQRFQHQRGQRLNTAYSSAQEQNHREVISVFRRTAQNPRIAPELRQFAVQMLPALQDHLNMANQLVATEGGGNHSSG
jgi:putative membrane protein